MKKILFLTLILIQTIKASELSLEEYLDLVARQNLDIKMSKYRLESVLSKSRVIGLPAPMISFVRQTVQKTKSNGFEISQDIPNPLSLSSAMSERILDADIETENNKKIKREMVSLAKYLYIKHSVLEQKSELIDQKKNVLQIYKNKMQSAFRTDYTFKLNELKIEGEYDQLLNDQDSILAQMEEIKIELATLVNQKKMDFVLKKYLPDIQDLNENGIIAQSASLNMKNLQIKNYENKEKSINKLWRPDFNLKYKSMESSSMSPASSEISVGITLPFVFPWDTNAEVGSIRSEQILQESEYAKEKRNIENKIQIQKIKLSTLKKQIERLDKTIIPNALKRKNVMDQVALRELESFQMKYEAMLSLPELKMQKLDLRLQYEELFIDISRDTQIND